jgi:hypothetical protein
MHMQPYSRGDTHPVPVQEQRGPMAERNGHAPQELTGYTGSPHQYLRINDPAQPSYFQVLLWQIGKRWRLLVFWLVLTTAVAVFVLVNFAQPMWKAEGTLIYQPDFHKKLYTPPNIQTILAMAKSGEVIDAVVKEKNLTNAGDVQSKLNIAIIKQSEIITVAFEWPSKNKAEDVANRVLELAIDQYDQLRKRQCHKMISGLDDDLKKAMDDELIASKKLNEMLGDRKIFDLKTEQSSVVSDITGLRNQIKTHEREQEALKKKIEGIDEQIADFQRKNQASAGKVTDADLGRLSQIQHIRTMLSQAREKLEKAKISLKPLQEKRNKWLPLYRQGYIRVEEMAELDRDIKLEQSIIAEQEREIKRLETTLESLENAVVIPETLRSFERDKSKYSIDLSAIPGILTALQKQLDERLKFQIFLQSAEKDALQLQQQIEAIKLRRNELIQEKRSHENIESDKTRELTIQKKAASGDAPVASNRLKLGAGTFALSLMLFVGFVALFDMPRALPAAVAASRSLLPAAHPQYPVPAWQSAPAAPSKPPGRGPDLTNEQLRALAARIAPAPNERGKIVLFTPTAKGLRLENLLGDLACLLTSPANKVLVFEARTEIENPSYPAWCGPASHEVADELESYLDGRTERTSACFAETLISSIDYARGDLSRQLQGVMAMYRFRRLMNDMKERYAVVLMITPERYQGEEDDVFTTLGEGIVVVVNQDANPADVEAYLRDLQASETPVYGAFTVPPGAAGK